MSTIASADLVSVRPRRAAEITGLGEATVRRLVRDGRLDSVRVGRSVLIPLASLERLLRGEARPADDAHPDEARR